MKDYKIADGVMLSDIDPNKGDKYSPNLYLWIRQKLRQYSFDRWQFATDGDGHAYLVNEWLRDDGSHDCYVSASLNGILCNGTRENTGIVVNIRLTPSCPDFWHRYKEVGRCAIDQKHETCFLNDDARWQVSEDGKTRICRWCGHTQRCEKYTVVKTRWVPNEAQS